MLVVGSSLIVEALLFAEGLSFVENCVEFTYLVRNTAIRKDHLDFVRRAQFLKIVLMSSNASISLREEKINSFWLISIVSVVSNTLPVFGRNIGANRWNTKCATSIID